MPRQTLPDFDPLAELGIVSGEPAAQAPRPTRRAAARELGRTKVNAAPAETEPPAAAPTASEVSTEDLPVATTQEVAASQPETAAEPPKPQGRVRAQLSLAASSTAAPRALKVKTSGRIPAELWEEVRDCVYWHGHRMTIDQFSEEAFRSHLARLRRQHSLGERFPVREHDLKQGRRVS
jgi:hypothetical protein